MMQGTGSCIFLHWLLPWNSAAMLNNSVGKCSKRDSSCSSGNLLKIANQGRTDSATLGTLHQSDSLQTVLLTPLRDIPSTHEKLRRAAVCCVHFARCYRVWHPSKLCGVIERVLIRRLSEKGLGWGCGELPECCRLQLPPESSCPALQYHRLVCKQKRPEVDYLDVLINIVLLDEWAHLRDWRIELATMKLHHCLPRWRWAGSLSGNSPHTSPPELISANVILQLENKVGKRTLMSWYNLSWPGRTSYGDSAACLDLMIPTDIVPVSFCSTPWPMQAWFSVLFVCRGEGATGRLPNKRHLKCLPERWELGEGRVYYVGLCSDSPVCYARFDQEK